MSPHKTKQLCIVAEDLRDARSQESPVPGPSQMGNVASNLLFWHQHISALQLITVDRRTVHSPYCLM
jgi:hypothetical protein